MRACISACVGVVFRSVMLRLSIASLLRVSSGHSIRDGSNDECQIMCFSRKLGDGSGANSRFIEYESDGPRKTFELKAKPEIEVKNSLKS